ncbi:MAG: hypothetical protein GXP63_05450 [DPANN group archaeon]|nr:hypothetical protein [DPANN group archaeon]
MSLLEKAMFWKKDDFSDLKLDDNLGADLGLGPEPGSSLTPSFADPQTAAAQPVQPPAQDVSGFGQQHMQQQMSSAPPQASAHPGMMPSSPSFQPSPSYAEPSPSQEVTFSTSHEAYLINKNIELISSKLDALRASLDSLGQRMANIERLAYSEDEKRNRGW